jgi:hypothetical protein
MRELVCFQQCPQSIAFHSHIILAPRVKENNGKKGKKQQNEQRWTLAYTLVFQTMSSPSLKLFFFWSNQLAFPPK